jgi:uncharacterized membrane protein
VSDGNGDRDGMAGAAAARPPAENGGGRTRLALMLSLALNLALAGLIAGALIRGGPDGGMARGPGDEVRDLLRAMPEGPQRALIADLRGQRDTFRQGWAEFRALRLALADAVAATPFDAARVAAALDDMAGFWDRMGGIGRGLIQTRIAAMSDAERAAFAEALRTDPPRDRGRGRGRDTGHDTGQRDRHGDDGN